MIASDPLQNVRAVLRTHWGFDSFRPLQAEAISAALQRRDSVVVVPTGGGKSLCYQAPAATGENGLTLVVSPLIALMKDQVDALTARGVPSALLNSSLDAAQRRDVTEGIRKNRYQLLYVAPERLHDDAFIEMLQSAGVRAVAIDEAHCISHWGHDFRPDYRRLSQLKTWFPHASIHAFTATATPRVRDDIAEQLGLADPVVLVGDFFRPNLIYRAKWRSGLKEQVREIIDANSAGAGIIYCIRRSDVDELCAYLQTHRYRALPYHAGLAPDVRKGNQDAFSIKETDIIVATVAFGMGIDRPDVRYVIHTGMPKSIESYQQETGRAGRDGLPADCTLFYTTADFMTWKAIVQKNDTQHLDAHLRQLGEMLDFCQSPLCRHKLLVEHFGQDHRVASCGACDTCLGERSFVSDSTTLAMKILSAVARTHERFGARYVADVLVGAASENVRTRGHDSLSVYGLMAEHHPSEICAWIDQLATLGFLHIGAEYRTFSLTRSGRELLKGEHEVNLVARPELHRKRTRRDQRGGPARREQVMICSDDEDPVDAALYESLRALRKKLAAAAALPLYCVVSNKTLEQIARGKPGSETELLAIPGIGQKKCAQYGEALLDCVRSGTST